MGFLKKLFGKDKEEAAEASPGIELRRMALTTSADQLGITPSETYPRIYAALMDFPVGQHIFSVFANTAGDVSLYSTSTFGIIGGRQHDNVREAGAVWLKTMAEEIDSAKPTSDIGYGQIDDVRFYFLTFDGLRMLEVPQATLSQELAAMKMFMVGQGVISELRQVSGG